MVVYSLQNSCAFVMWKMLSSILPGTLAGVNSAGIIRNTKDFGQGRVTLADWYRM